jgi:putative transposase
VFPDTIVQTCIVHLLRYSMQFVAAKDRTELAAQLCMVYRVPSAQAAAAALETFEQSPWGLKYPTIPKAGAGTGRR